MDMKSSPAINLSPITITIKFTVREINKNDKKTLIIKYF